MNRLNRLFARKPRNILSVYCTAGYPDMDATRPVMRALQEHGADIIELGIPYSDPLADGPVIQHSNRVALGNGMTIKKLFAQLERFREEISVPVILMGYMNPVLQYGFEKFCRDAALTGIDGLILPDLPVVEYEKEYRDILQNYKLDFIFLVTPETPPERVRKLDSLSSGFLYVVSASATTGGEQAGGNLDAYLERLTGMGLRNKLLVGFGIRDKPGFDAVCRRADGVIIGSAYIKALENRGDVNATTKLFCASILG